MGQYWKVANLDKREFINPHQLGVGLKQVEQIHSTPSTVHALFAALFVPQPTGARGGGDLDDHHWIGRWSGDRIAIVGDYTETNDLAVVGFDIAAVYDLCAYDDEDKTEVSFTDVSDLAASWIEQVFDGKFVRTEWGGRDFLPNDGGHHQKALAPDMVLGIKKD